MNKSYIVSAGHDLRPDGIPVDKMLFSGKLKLEHWRDGVLLNTYEFPNGITNVGKNLILDVMFNSATQVSQSSWCIGIIDNSGFSAVAAGDTMASHSGWNEFTNYNQSTRVAWGSGSASSQQTTNSVACTFDMLGTATLQGVFITSNNTKSGTTGSLWSTALFPSTIPVNNGDQLKITYAVAC